MRLRVALAFDWFGHKLRIPGALQFYLCQWVGREMLKQDDDPNEGIDGSWPEGGPCGDQYDHQRGATGGWRS